MLVGTWRAATWAIDFYARHGFRLVTDEEKNHLLKKYWIISERQIETSVVLADARSRPGRTDGPSAGLKCRSALQPAPSHGRANSVTC